MNYKRMPSVLEISSYDIQGNTAKIKCPRCKHDNWIGSVLKTDHVYHKKVKCWYCKAVTFDVSFIPEGANPLL